MLSRSHHPHPHTLVKHVLDVICPPNLGQNLLQGRELFIGCANFGFASTGRVGGTGTSGTMIVDVATPPVAIQTFVSSRACASSLM